jgi:hypothetical protein
VLRQHLRRDDNVCLGVIVRYYEDGPTYAPGGAAAPQLW